MRHPLNFADIVSADVIIEGQVIAFDPDRWDAITVITRKNIKGTAPDKFSFGTAAFGYSFKVVPELHLGERRIFALAKVPLGSQDTSYRYHLISEPCTNTFAFPPFGDVARAIDLIFDQSGDPVTEARVLAQFLDLTGQKKQ